LASAAAFSAAAFSAAALASASASAFAFETAFASAAAFEIPRQVSYTKFRSPTEVARKRNWHFQSKKSVFISAILQAGKQTSCHF
jgi:hypothetical protein